jgi:hypothetical protein
MITADYHEELCTLNRDYYVALAVLRQAIVDCTAQYERDRAALDAKYNVGADLHHTDPRPGDTSGQEITIDSIDPDSRASQ